MDYLIDNGEDTGVGVGCILSQVEKQISKWLNCGIRQDHDKAASRIVDVKLADGGNKYIEKMNHFNEIQFAKY